MTPSDPYTFHPLTPDRWPDLEALFGPRSATGGCWCMWWRLKHSEFNHLRGEGNRQAMHAIVDSGDIPGLIAFDGELPVGWVSVAPRQAFPVLDRSPILKRVDDQPVWSLVCFFIARSHRSLGLTPALVQAAIDYARQNGARILEAYPDDPHPSSPYNPDSFTGLASTFRNAGFVEVARRSAARPIMRYHLTE